ncbi:MAG TPA: hypothetical protein VFB62_25395, partial [Polyangiaceae bacterium]|nr:hypothetical protein [Polyangiaceae bacterium]
MRRLAILLACCAACAPPAPPVCAVPGRWSDGPYFEVARGRHRAALLPGDRLMVVGGSINVHANDDAGMEIVGFDGSLARYDKAPRRIGHSVTRLHDGRVLIIGGTGAEAPHDSQPTFLYDARLDAWTFPRALVNAPVYHTATLLEDGRLLLVGGRYNGFP